jgi:hypothetical protein
MIKKLTSRKFWVLVAILVTNALTLFGVDNETITKVVALVASSGATIAYLFIQGKLDSQDYDDGDQNH